MLAIPLLVRRKLDGAETYRMQMDISKSMFSRELIHLLGNENQRSFIDRGILFDIPSRFIVLMISH